MFSDVSIRQGKERQWAWDESAKQMLYHSFTLFHDDLCPFLWLRILNGDRNRMGSFSFNGLLSCLSSSE